MGLRAYKHIYVYIQGDLRGKVSIVGDDWIGTCEIKS